MSLGHKVKTIRESRGKSQTELAEAAGVEQSYISAIENEKKDNVSNAVLKKMATFLNVPYEVLAFDDAALPQDILDMPLEMAAWAAKKKNNDYIALVKKAQEDGFGADEMEEFYKFFRAAKKGKL